jgi:hypothetical protein
MHMNKHINIKELIQKQNNKISQEPELHAYQSTELCVCIKHPSPIEIKKIITRVCFFRTKLHKFSETVQNKLKRERILKREDN